MSSTPNPGMNTADTSLGPVEYSDRGDGDPVLFVHGSPGGADQGALMGSFLVPHGFRIIAPARPGYMETPLTDDNATPDQQADLHLALLDSLGVDRFDLLFWSGGGPSSYRLAAKNPERVKAMAALAALSKDYTFEHPHEEAILAGRFGGWLMKMMAKHSPKSSIKMIGSEEGDLTKGQVKELTEHIWSEPDKREFVLGLLPTVAGKERKAGFKNDQKQFPLIDDLGLATIQTPVLLVHGTADCDVEPVYSEHALEQLPNADIIRVADGTHISAWTDPTSDDIQKRIIEHFRA